MLLNNDCISDKIKEEIKRYLEINKNEDTTIQNLCDTGKGIIRGEIHSVTGLFQKNMKKLK